MKINEQDRLKRLVTLHRERCELLGLDLNDPEIKGTPTRCAKADVEQFTSDPCIYTTFNNDYKYDQMIVKPRIRFSSLCSHHLYPYFGDVHIGYIPRSKVIGLSKLARLVRNLSKGAQSQEWLTKKVTDFIVEILKPKGVMVIIEARHTCESCRGIRNNDEDSVFITSEVYGCFRREHETRDEFLSLIKKR